jgi:ribosomal protein S18 acetylase RimI-like enzyme
LLLRALHDRLPEDGTYVLMVIVANDGAVRFYERHGLEVAEHVDGPEYMHERMGVQFPPGTARVPALIMRYRKRRGDA